MGWREEYKSKLISMKDAAKLIQSGDFIGSGLSLGSASPQMYDAILDRWQELENVTLSDLTPVRPARLYDLEFMLRLDGHINYHPAFGMPLTRKIISPVFPIISSNKATISVTGMGNGRMFISPWSVLQMSKVG